jgi:hypothetical protein
MYISTLTKSKLNAQHPIISKYILSESNKLREKENSGMDHIKRLHTLLFSESRLPIHHHQYILVLGSSVAKTADVAAISPWQMQTQATRCSIWTFLCRLPVLHHSDAFAPVAGVQAAAIVASVFHPLLVGTPLHPRRHRH